MCVRTAAILREGQGRVMGLGQRVLWWSAYGGCRWSGIAVVADWIVGRVVLGGSRGRVLLLLLLLLLVGIAGWRILLASLMRARMCERTEERGSCGHGGGQPVSVVFERPRRMQGCRRRIGAGRDVAVQGQRHRSGMWWSLTLR